MSSTVVDHFQPGETLLTCSPWITSVNVGLRDIVCANCFSHVSKLPQSATMKTCSACKAVSYCGKECQTPHWTEEHKVECGFLRRLFESEEGRLMFHGQMVQGMPHSLLAADPYQLTRRMMMLKLTNKILRGSTKDPEYLSKFETFLSLKFVYPNELPPPRVERGTVNGKPIGKVTIEEVDRLKVDEYRSVAMAAFELTREEYRDKLESKYNLDEMFQRIRCWEWCVLLGGNRNMKVGESFFLEIPQLDLSCEPNSIMTGNPKNIVIRALGPIPKPLRLRDCKVAFHPRVIMDYPFPAELNKVSTGWGKSCSGKFCTPKYHAEMLPLRCTNTSCDQPVPSDDRSLKPCPKCKSVMRADRLKTGQLRLNQLRVLYSDVSKPPTERIIKLRTDTLIHPDNLFAVLVITGSLDQLSRQSGYLWSTARQMLPFIRKCYPKNDQTLAALLGFVANDYEHITNKSYRQLEEGREYVREAYEIQVRFGSSADVGQAFNWYGMSFRPG